MKIQSSITFIISAIFAISIMFLAFWLAKGEWQYEKNIQNEMVNAFNISNSIVSGFLCGESCDAS
ncbi:MAG: hypothetical protein QXS81_01910 [Candidatus Micrarchaeaceae archaeon]